MTDRPLPLEGVVVLDRTCDVGELCGRILGDLGATVLRLEPPGGAASRHRPPLAPDGTSLWWIARNTNKQSVVIEDEPSFEALLAQADALIDSSLSYAAAQALTARHPHLVLTSITWLGLEGPYADLQANDDVVTAMSGWLASVGRSDETPVLVPGSLPSDGASVMGALATLMALWQQRETQCGQLIDVSALEATIQLDSWSISNASAIRHAGGSARRVRTGEKQIYPVVKGSDGWARLVVLAPRHWNSLWQWMGSPEAFADTFWAAAPNRFANADVLAPYFDAHYAAMSIEDAAVESQRRGVVVTPMSSPRQLLADEHLGSRGTFTMTTVSARLDAPIPDGMFTIDRGRMGFRRPAPAVGAHRAPPARVRPASPRRGEHTDAVPFATPALPLEGLKVVDFGHGGVGVQAGRMLADYGADVIKIESRHYIDFMRVMSGKEMSPSFASSSRTKRSFGVNLKDPTGVELVKQLVAWADVAIENNSTGTMDKLGLGYDELSRLNPRLVYVSSQLLGAHGTRAHWSGYGPSVQAYGGLSYLWRHPGTAPPAHMANHPDMMAGHVCAIAALAGLFTRSQDGRGAHCEVAQVEAVIATLADLVMAEYLRPGSVHPDGNDDERGAPWGVFRCSGDEEYAVICVASDREWQALRTAMDCPAWSDDERFATAAGRLAARGDLNDLVRTWTAQHTPWDVASACQAHGVTAGPMLYAADLLDDPHLAARDFAVAIDQPGAGPLLVEGAAFIASGMPRARARPAPALGEHTREICRDLLGLTDDTIGALFDAGVLEES